MTNLNFTESDSVKVQIMTPIVESAVRKSFSDGVIEDWDELEVESTLVE